MHNNSGVQEITFLLGRGDNYFDMAQCNGFFNDIRFRYDSQSFIDPANLELYFASKIKTPSEIFQELVIVPIIQCNQSFAAGSERTFKSFYSNF